MFFLTKFVFAFLDYKYSNDSMMNEYKIKGDRQEEKLRKILGSVLSSFFQQFSF